MAGDDQHDGAEPGSDAADAAPATPVVKLGAVIPSVTDALAAAVSGRRKAVRKSNKNLKPVPPKAEKTDADAPSEAADAPAADQAQAPAAQMEIVAAEADRDENTSDGGPVGGGTPTMAEVAGAVESPAPDAAASVQTPPEDDSIESGPVGGGTPSVAEVATSIAATDAGTGDADTAGDRHAVPGQDAHAGSDHAATSTDAGNADAVPPMGQASETASADAPSAATGDAPAPATADGPTATSPGTTGDMPASVSATTPNGDGGAASTTPDGAPSATDGAAAAVSSEGTSTGLNEAAVETTSLADYRQAQDPGAVVAEPVVPDTADLPPAELRAAVESLLFVSTKPMSVAKLAGCLPGTSAAYLDGFLAGLAARYDHERRGWELLRIANGWQLLTRKELHPWVRQLDRKELPTKLTKGALETLAIVAYKQPIARGAIEDIRGVQCGPVLRQLMDMKLVQVSGRDDNLLGRPLLYGTTDHFLQRFGLGGINDLPAEHEFGA